MKKIFFWILVGMFVANSADLYGRLKFEEWTKTHKPSQGMPHTWDMELAGIIARPIDALVELNQSWCENEKD